MQQQLNADSVVLNHVKSRNSTWLKLAIDDQHWNSTIHNVITHTRQIETDYRLKTDYHKPIIDYVKNSIFTSLIKWQPFSHLLAFYSFGTDTVQ